MNNTKTKLEKFLKTYGFGLLAAANIFGAGSVYILAGAGSTHKYALHWTLIISLLVGLVMHEMAIRLAVQDKPLMTWLRQRNKHTAIALAGLLAIIMPFWTTANYASFGAATSLLFTGQITNLLVISGSIVAFIFASVLLTKGVYESTEKAISAMVGIFVLAFTAVLFMDPPNATTIAQGLIPSDISGPYLAMVIAMFGTTVYYPNFWIQSSLSHSKDWKDTKLKTLRKDNVFGLTVAVITSLIVLTVNAYALPEPTSHLGFADPAIALSGLGTGAFTLFLIGVAFASLTSGTGTLFALGFIIPQALGKKVDFADNTFNKATISALAYGTALIPPLLYLTEITIVEMAQNFPAANGAIGLPITAALLYAAANKEGEISLKFKIIAGITVLFFLITSLTTAQGLYDTMYNALFVEVGQ